MLVKKICQKCYKKHEVDWDFFINSAWEYEQEVWCRIQPHPLTNMSIPPNCPHYTEHIVLYQKRHPLSKCIHILLSPISKIRWEIYKYVHKLSKAYSLYK